MSHVPVLLNEVTEFLKLEPGKFFIDGTVDGGGHAKEILKGIGAEGKVLGVDWDESMIEKLKRGAKNLIPVHGNYADIPEILRKEKMPKADGLLLDLGFSSDQLESSGRGFSFNPPAGGDEPLLMTYDDSEIPVKEILKTISEKELADAIYELSGERFSRRIAAAIKTREKKKPIETTGELNETIKSALPKNYERGRIEPATRTFQALRIYANRELENLEKILKELPSVLKPGGRVAIISFHSLEDRIVKKNFKRMARDGTLEIITPKPVRPTREEARENPRSRSAMLRVAEIINNQETDN